MSVRPWSWRQAILRSTLPSTTRLTLLTLSCHINDAGQAACVSTAKLAEESGLSERAVISHLKSVEGTWVTVQRHGYGDRRWRGNEYMPRLPDEPVLEVAPAAALSAEKMEVSGVGEGSDIQARGAERGSVPQADRGAERGDEVLNVVQCPGSNEALNVVHPLNGFVLDLNPPTPQPLKTWFDEVFWRRYPNRECKAKALAQLEKLKPSTALLAAIERGLTARLEHERILRIDPKQFVPSWPHPHRWLRDRRWESQQLDLPPALKAIASKSDHRCVHCGKAGVRQLERQWWCRDHEPELASVPRGTS